ncbi:ATP-binding protein [Nostocoides sp.]
MSDGAVHFAHVSFAYGGDSHVLHDIDFAVTPGQTVALVGPTGSGKSSIVDAAAPLLRPDRRCSAASTASTCAR